MSTVASSSVVGFVDRVSRLLARADYRVAEDDGTREAIYRLRYDAYLREGAIGPDPSHRFTDPEDERPNAWIFGIYIDGELASSVRLHVAIDGRGDLPASHVFPDFLTGELDAGKTIVDPTRFVADAAATRLYPELPYLTLRACHMAADFFDADDVLATVRAEHQAFYRRVFGHRPVCPPRPYPSLSKPITLMSLDFQALRATILRRYPFFGSSSAERGAIFGPRATALAA